MNEIAQVFRPDDITVTLGGKEYRLVYDLNAFCELEKMYDSVDSVLQMLLGVSDVPDMNNVVYDGKHVDADKVLVAGVPLIKYIADKNQVKTANNTDTRNLLWVGLLHDNAVYDDNGDIKSYSISKSQIGTMITFRNLREMNGKMMLAILRDLLPPKQGNASKNVTAPAETPAQ